MRCLRHQVSYPLDTVGKNVVFDIPDGIEQAGYSKATKARLDSQKLQSLGWKALIPIQEGVRRTINILSSGTM